MDGKRSFMRSVKNFPVLRVVVRPTTNEVRITLDATSMMILAEKLSLTFLTNPSCMWRLFPWRLSRRTETCFGTAGLLPLLQSKNSTQRECNGRDRARRKTGERRGSNGNNAKGGDTVQCLRPSSNAAARVLLCECQLDQRFLLQRVRLGGTRRRAGALEALDAGHMPSAHGFLDAMAYERERTHVGR